MPNVNALADTESQPVALGELIALKSTSITVIRNGVTQAAQTVRLETLGSQRQILGENGQTYGVDAFVLGYKNYPGKTDTNLKSGDRFMVGTVHYEVVIVMPAHTDCVQAFLRVRS